MASEIEGLSRIGDAIFPDPTADNYLVRQSREPRTADKRVHLRNERRDGLNLATPFADRPPPNCANARS